MDDPCECNCVVCVFIASNPEGTRNTPNHVMIQNLSRILALVVLFHPLNKT